MAGLNSESPADTQSQPDENGAWSAGRIITIATAVFAAIIILVVALAIVLMLVTSNVTQTAQIVQLFRDVFIIVLTMLSVIMVILLGTVVYQVARLVNVVQSGSHSVLEHTQEAAQNVRVTTEFVSDQVIEPVIRVSSFLAGLAVLLRELGGLRRAIQPDDEHEDHRDSD